MRTGLNFGQALEALKSNQCISREGWNGKGMFLFLNKGNEPFPSHIEGVDGQRREATMEVFKGCTQIEAIKFGLFEIGDKGTIRRLPNINMRAATGSTVTGWLASQTDLLAEDWCILEPGASQA